VRQDTTRLGATLLGDGTCRFRVWAPFVESAALRLHGGNRRIVLEKSALGYHEAIVEGVAPNSLYSFSLDNGPQRPDPASRMQPEGVHGPSAVVAERFSWDDPDWSGPALAEYIIYELHVGTFTSEGTFEAIIPYLDYLADLGVNAVELMPIAEFPGARNWGYDGVYPFAAHHSYGGPAGLKKLVNACHRRGLAVVLDVVYNHLGPEGNYLGEFAPYFTDRYQSPWGRALNFDGSYSDPVREFFIENALYWLDDCRVDALRLDAVHAILDHAPITFLEDLASAVEGAAERSGRRMLLIAESADNDARLLRPRERGGYGLDGQWNDDFHHALRTLLTGERAGYYEDYGEFSQLAKAFREGFIYTGEYSPFRKRRHGSSSADVPAHRFVVFSQNHDQVGNRIRGDRLSETLSLEQLKLAASLVILSPFVPLLFMGEEYGEKSPFPYFVSHSDPELIAAVRRGRREEFASFQWQGEVPDPQDEATFLSAKLRHDLRAGGEHKTLLEFYRELMRVRKSLPALARAEKNATTVTDYAKEKVLAVERHWENDRVLMLANLDGGRHAVDISLAAGRWRKVFDSTESRWGGTGSEIPGGVDVGKKISIALGAYAAVLFQQENRA
jgi:maltooligosyltrehalose trehalohydrolase